MALYFLYVEIKIFSSKFFKPDNTKYGLFEYSHKVKV